MEAYTRVKKDRSDDQIQENEVRAHWAASGAAAAAVAAATAPAAAAPRLARCASRL